MKRLRRLVTGMAVASVVVSSAAWAADAENPVDDAVRKPRRERRERQERSTCPEALARFKAADTDGNGTLSLAEFTVVYEKRAAEMKERRGDKWNAERAAKRPSAEDIFAKLDADKNGELTPAEMARGIRARFENRDRPGAQARFKAADTDGNGTLSLAEFTVVHAKRAAEMKERRGDKWNAERTAKRPSAEDIFAKLDADKNGELTPAEMARGMRARFEKRQRRGRGRDKKDVKPGGDESVIPVVPDAPVGI